MRTVATVAGAALLKALGGSDDVDYQSPTANMITAIESEAAQRIRTVDLDRKRLARALRFIHGDVVPLPNRCSPEEYAGIIARFYEPPTISHDRSYCATRTTDVNGAIQCQCHCPDCERGWHESGRYW